MSLLTVPGPPEPVTMSASGPLVHRCPFVHEEDRGHVTITWTTSGNTLELHELATYLAQFEDMEISHEDLTDRIRDDLGAVKGIYRVGVRTTWTTAGLEISCNT